MNGFLVRAGILLICLLAVAYIYFQLVVAWGNIQLINGAAAQACLDRNMTLSSNQSFVADISTMKLEPTYRFITCSGAGGRLSIPFCERLVEGNVTRIYNATYCGR